MNPNNPELKSFIETHEHSDFPIQNLPYAAFKTPGMEEFHIGTAIGDYILDLTEIEKKRILPANQCVFQEGSLKSLMNAGRTEWSHIRQKISELLRHDNPVIKDNRQLRQSVLLPMQNAIFQVPVEIGDYTDFYSSEDHARNVGSMFRDKNNPLLPNWKHLPVGYHGRASSIIISGTNFPRPVGQILNPAKNEPEPELRPCCRLDFELELAFIVGKNSPLGKPVHVDQSDEYIFGAVLMNDWSARDIQKWEYVPLGPFVSKSFATSISPWVVTMDALKPFKAKAPQQDPQPLAYLQQKDPSAGRYDIDLQVSIKAKEADKYQTICRSNAKNLYWSMAQQLAHHTVTGCNVNIGDLMASGTISGKEPETFGSLLELTWNGSTPLKLEGDIERTFIEDDDLIRMTGWAQGNGYRVGFGEVTGGPTASAF